MTSAESQPGSGRAEGRLPGETSIVAVFNSFHGRWRLISALSLAGLIVGGAFGFMRPHLYTSHASFTTDDPRTGASSSLSQLGLAGLLGGGSQSAQMYLDLLQSPVILDPVLDSVYAVTRDGKISRVTLAKLYAGHTTNAIKARATALGKLGSNVKGELRPSGAVAVDVTTPDRSLSQQIASRILNSLNAFSLARRQARAGTEREFNEGRVAAARTELRAAEARLEAFMQDNRAFRNSPSLTLEQDRLQRDVAFRQTLYTAVAQAYEQARLEEARNTPTVSVVEPADLPLVEAPRWGGLKSGLLGLVVGFVLALTIVVVRDFFGRSVSANADDATEFHWQKEDLTSGAQRTARI